MLTSEAATTRPTTAAPVTASPGAAGKSTILPPPAIPPQLIKHAGQRFVDGGHYSWRVESTGDFTCVAQPASATKKSVGAKVTSKDATQWPALCAMALAALEPAAAATTAQATAAPAAPAAPQAAQPSAPPAATGFSIEGFLAELTSGTASLIDVGSQLVGAVSDTIGAAIDGLTGPVEAPGVTPSEDGPCQEPVFGSEPDTSEPEAPQAKQMVVPGNARIYVNAGDKTNKRRSPAAPTPVTVLETRTLPKTVANVGSDEKAMEDWNHVQSADKTTVDGWVKYGGLTREDDFAPDLAAKLLIPTAGLKDTALDIALIWNEKGGYIDRVRGEIERAVALAVMYVESRGLAFTGTAAPVTRFEVHHLFSSTDSPLPVDWGAKHVATFDNHFRPHAGANDHEMNETGAAEGGAWTPFHGSATLEQAAIRLATTLADRETALRCASFGAGQVMGSNAQLEGYGSATEMYDAMNGDVHKNLDGLFTFIAKTPGALDALKAKDYAKFGKIYNGSTSYGPLIAAAVDTFTPLEAKHLAQPAAAPEQP